MQDTELESYDDLYESDQSIHSVVSETEHIDRQKQQQDIQFLKGCAISMWQNSGDSDSNWTRFTHERIRCGMQSTITDGSKELFPDTWNRYVEDIQLLKELGCNAFRLSIEWARIEPEKGKFDNEAIQRYHEIFDCLEENGITPCVTLHHFVHPGWFQDLGGFENEENIQLFVQYATRAFQEFGTRATLWATFNEPTVYTFCSYLAGVHAPGKTFKFSLAGQVLLNILKAHCETYKALKELDKSKKIAIGIVHHHIWFKPSGNSPLHFFAKLACKWMTFWWGRDIVLKFFKTGNYKWSDIHLVCCNLIKLVPTGKCLSFSVERLILLMKMARGLQWIGGESTTTQGVLCVIKNITLFDSRVQASWWLSSVAVNGEIMTEMSYPIYPKGLYRSIAASSQLNVPIYITETGIADSIDDKRHLMIRGYTNEILRAIKHGYDVRGMFYWTLVDNFEWNLGYTVRFGLYEFNPSKGIDRRLRTNAKPLQEIYKKWPDKMNEMYKFAKETNIPPFEDITKDYLDNQRQYNQQSAVLQYHNE
eukprot:g2987.t1